MTSLAASRRTNTCCGPVNYRLDPTDPALVRASLRPPFVINQIYSPACSAVCFCNGRRGRLLLNGYSKVADAAFRFSQVSGCCHAPKSAIGARGCQSSASGRLLLLVKTKSIPVPGASSWRRSTCRRVTTTTKARRLSCNCRPLISCSHCFASSA